MHPNWWIKYVWLGNKNYEMASLSDNSLCDSPRNGDVSMQDLIPKKVLFREKDAALKETVVVDSLIDPKVSWKEKLVGSPSGENRQPEEDDDLEVLDGDIQISNINGTPSIYFSDRIFQILAKDMANTVVIKLLGRNIGFSILQNKIYDLWKPSSSSHLMDIENGYF